MPGSCAVCNQPSGLTCGGCKLINYCGKDHQKIHWKQTHKKNCQPLYFLQQNDKLGRYLVAARDIQKGDVIFQEPPLVVGPKSITFPVCLGCHVLCNPENYHECDGCGFPLCSPRCQVSDHHIDECRVMMEAKFRARIDSTMSQKEVSYFPIVPLRCLLLRERNLNKFETLMSLQSHLEDRINKPLFQIYKKNIAGFIIERLGKKLFSENNILTVAGILDTNAFEVGTNTSKVRGLYNVASMLAHDCKPNTKHSFISPELTIVVSATTDIKAGEVLSTTYTQTFWDTLSRREHLKSVKCFDCDCQRCTDPTELGTYMGAVRCMRCTTPQNFRNGPYILSENPLDSSSCWKCKNCGHEMTAKQIKSGNDNLKEELSRPGVKTVEGLEKFLEKYGAYGAGVLHPNNYHVVQVKHALIQLLGNKAGYLYSELADDLLNKKIDYCRELLDLVDVLDPKFSKIRGEILNELQAAMVIQAKRQFNQGKITESAAQKVLLNAFTILKEVVEILRFDLDVSEFENRLTILSKELDA